MPKLSNQTLLVIQYLGNLRLEIKRDGSEDLLSVMKESFILYKKIDITAPYATNKPFSFSI